MILAKRFVVEGIVQGVSYRFFTLTCAEALGIKGWVSNREDGTVEVHAEGKAHPMAEFEFDLSRGSRFARVSNIEGREVPVEKLDGFKIRR